MIIQVRENFNKVYNYKKELSLFLIITFGLVIRLFVAKYFDINVDEAISYEISKYTPFSDLLLSKGLYWDLVHPPLYYLFLKTWLIVADSLFGMRLISIIFYLLTNFFLYKLLRHDFSKTVCLISLLLFAFNPLFILIGSIARMYSLGLLLNIIAIYFIRKSITNNLTKFKIDKNEFFSALFLGLSFLTYYGSIWLYFSFFAFSFLQRNIQISLQIIRILVLALVINLYQIYTLLIAVFVLNRRAGSVEIDYSGFDSYFSHYYHHFFSIFGIPNYFDSFLLLLLLALITKVVILPIIFNKKKNFEKFYILLIISSLSISIIAGYILNVHTFLDRQMILVSLSFVILISHFLFQLYATKQYFLFIIIFSFIGYSYAVSSNHLSYFFTRELKYFVQQIDFEKPYQIVILYHCCQQPVTYYLEKSENKRIDYKMTSKEHLIDLQIPLDTTVYLFVYDSNDTKYVEESDFCSTYSCEIYEF